MSRVCAFPALGALLVACPSPGDTDDNPLIGDRLVEGTVHFEGHEDLDEHAFESTTPVSNRFSSPDGLGNYLVQLTFTSDETAPSVSASFSIGSDTGVVQPGEYPVDFEIPAAGPFATLTLSVANQDPVYSATGIGATGTITIESIEDGVIAGHFDVGGDAGWTSGTGAPAFTLEGTFAEVPVTEL